MINLEANIEPTADLTEEKDMEDSNLLEEETNFLQSVIITRLVVEGGVAAMKVPLVLALCAMLFFGRVDLALIVSASKVPRLLKTVFQYDAAILHNLFNGVDAVHLQTDLSSRKGEERLSIWLTFASLLAAGTANMPAAYNINRRIVWNGAVTSKEGKVIHYCQADFGLSRCLFEAGFIHF